MTRQEYENIQAKLRRKLDPTNGQPCGLSGNRKEGYELGINSAMSIIKEIYEKGDKNNEH